MRKLMRAESLLAEYVSPSNLEMTFESACSHTENRPMQMPGVLYSQKIEAQYFGVQRAVAGAVFRCIR